MVRPCFLVIDDEHPDSISTRKLVLETAKYNVITAYSGPEAIETLRYFPAVSGVVMNEATPGMGAAELILELRAIRPDMLIVLTGGSPGDPGLGSSHRVGSFDPAALLQLLRRLVPNPYEQWSR